MEVKEKVWLISTKDVESLFDSESMLKKTLINGENSVPYQINDKIHLSSTLTLSFINFYSDYLNPYNSYDNFDYYQTNMSDKIKKTEEIQIKLIEYLKENERYERSSIYFDKIFRLIDSSKDKRNIFLARCFPNKFRDIKINKIKLSDYWLLCYMQTVANILGKKIEEIDFFGLFHNGDINIENGKKFSLVTSGFWNGQIQNITAYKYSHDSYQDEYYKDIILNSEFFDDLKSDDNDHFYMLGKLTFNGIIQRRKLLSDIGIRERFSIEDWQFLLCCQANEVDSIKENFKLLWNIDINDFIK